MWPNSLLRCLMGGFALGITIGLINDGFTNSLSTFGYGMGTSVALAGMHSLRMVSNFNAQAEKERKSRLINKRLRREAHGTFSERLENYMTTAGTDDAGSDDFRSSMPFWSTVDLNDCHQTPPKPARFIRMLLARIRHALSNEEK